MFHNTTYSFNVLIINSIDYTISIPVCLFGIFGNFFNIVTYCKSEKHAINVYLIALSLNDTIRLAINLYLLIQPINGSLIEFFLLITSMNNSWLRCIISMDCFISIVDNPINKSRNYSRPISITIFIHFSSTIYSTPSLIWNSLITNSFYYVLFNNVISALIPCVLVLFLNLRIIIALVKRKKINKNTNRQKSRSSIIKMLALIVTLFLLTKIYNSTINLLGYTNNGEILKRIGNILVSIHSASTFVICYQFSIHFRNTFKTLFLPNHGDQVDGRTDFSLKEKYDLTTRIKNPSQQRSQVLNSSRLFVK